MSNIKSNFIKLFLICLLLPLPTFAECELFYAGKSDFENRKKKNADIRSFSKSLNFALQKPVDFANTLDKYTLGLVSYVLTRSIYSIEDLSPIEWGKFTVAGRLIYSDSPLNTVPLRGTKIIMSEGKSSVELYTGAEGEFKQYFHKLVPYSRLRLFPAPIFEHRDKLVRTAKIPVKIRVESKACNAELSLTEVPFEPIVLVVTNEKFNENAAANATVGATVSPNQDK